MLRGRSITHNYHPLWAPAEASTFVEHLWIGPEFEPDRGIGVVVDGPVVGPAHSSRRVRRRCLRATRRHQVTRRADGERRLLPLLGEPLAELRNEAVEIGEPLPRSQHHGVIDLDVLVHAHVAEADGPRQVLCQSVIDHTARPELAQRAGVRVRRTEVLRRRQVLSDIDARLDRGDQQIRDAIEPEVTLWCGSDS